VAVILARDETVRVTNRRTVESGTNREKENAYRAAKLTRRRPAQTLHDKITKTQPAPMTEIQEDPSTSSAHHLNILVPPHVRAVRHDRMHENGHWLT
jgi:hypothetical protein